MAAARRIHRQSGLGSEIQARTSAKMAKFDYEDTVRVSPAASEDFVAAEIHQSELQPLGGE
ncbi:hypothetical protein LEN_2522 [Lysobacter enzymogenes]|uniref:Uncharacterized protein n=1 Tax=Lysobacter enzymogenes TaxID=69 RepID=A0AAU9AHA0_LYSEN|nr:hypothetical protein LEN_2522 [Lysobacter enzymogenes]